MRVKVNRSRTERLRVMLIVKQELVYSLILHLISCSSLSAACSIVSPCLILKRSSCPFVTGPYSLFVVAGIAVLASLSVLQAAVNGFHIWLLDDDRQVHAVSQVLEMPSLINSRWEIIEDNTSGVSLLADHGVFLQECLQIRSVAGIGSPPELAECPAVKRAYIFKTLPCSPSISPKTLIME